MQPRGQESQEMHLRGELFATYWAAGALCRPPLNIGGITPKLVLFVVPSCAKTAPLVPGAVDCVKGALICQHSRVDSCWSLVAIVVMLSRVGGAGQAANTVVMAQLAKAIKVFASMVTAFRAGCVMK